MVWTVIVLQNGNIASGSGDQTIKIWDSTTGALIQTLTGHTGGVLRLTVLQNVNFASGSEDCSIKIWNSTTGTLIKTFSTQFFSIEFLVQFLVQVKV